MDKNVKEFWEKDKLKNIKPTDKEFPEGFDPRLVLRKMLRSIDYDLIVDLGCGYGRLCEAFSQEKYVGVDISSVALQAAENRNPDYTFVTYDEKPKADVYLAYTVFLHLSDAQLRQELASIKAEYFIVAEILGSEWGNGGKGDPPTYNRDDYSIMEEFGYSLIEEIKLPYKRYVGTKMASGKNTDISFLLWRLKNDFNMSDVQEQD